MDLKLTPYIAEGNLAITFEVCAPNQRPIQKTKDLSYFWQHHYPSIRLQYRGRYPKHKWPETVGS